MDRPESSLPPAAQEWNPKVGIVLGSGLGGFVDAMEGTQALSYEQFPDLPQSTVPGHEGRFVYGKVGPCDVVAGQGRVHLYEGLSAAEVTASVRALAAMGIELLVLTNAAGTANPDFAVGRWMQIADHLNLAG